METRSDIFLQSMVTIQIRNTCYEEITENNLTLFNY